MMNVRPNYHDGEIGAIVAHKQAIRQIKGNDYYRIPTDINESEAIPLARLSQARLEELSNIVSLKDKEVLKAISDCHYLMTRQIQRLLFFNSSTPSACMTAATRALKKLKSYGLIDTFKRRIGGVRAGSASFVWHLTEGGIRFLNLQNEDNTSRKRFLEPSYAFMQHTLSVAECYIRIVELCRDNNSLSLKTVEFEPDCWRRYIYSNLNSSLNPDLFIATRYGEYEDRWFIEIDLSTESVQAILAKCERYHQYYRTSAEQKANGVYPVTLWIVPDLKRKNKLESKIKHEYANKVKLFRVITMDELDGIIVNGCDPNTLY